jgi:hypothetical protein
MRLFNPFLRSAMVVLKHKNWGECPPIVRFLTWTVRMKWMSESRTTPGLRLLSSSTGAGALRMPTLALSKDNDMSHLVPDDSNFSESSATVDRSRFLISQKIPIKRNHVKQASLGLLLD